MIQRFLCYSTLSIAIGVCLALGLVSGCNKNTPSPRPTPGPTTEYSPAKRLPHTIVADVWNLHLDSKRLSDNAALTTDGEFLIPARTLGESLGKRVDWDFNGRFVSWDGQRLPSVYLILQTAYLHEEQIDELLGDYAEVDAKTRSVIVHTCAGEGKHKAGC